LAQAEHDTVARVVLVTTCASLIPAVEQQLTQQLAVLPTRDVASEALKNSFCLLAGSTEEAIDIADKIAPEHLEVVTEDAEGVSRRLKNYGGLFIGNSAAEVLGDYGIGPNHTLPTSGTAKYTGGLSVFNFLRIRTWLNIHDLHDPTCQQAVRDSVDLAELEGLVGHSRSARCRLTNQSSLTPPAPSIRVQQSESPTPDTQVTSASLSQLDHLADTNAGKLQRLIRPDVGSLMAYTPVKPLDVVAEEIGVPIDDLCKLDANENIYGIQSDVVHQIMASSRAMHIYPDPDQNALRDMLSKFTKRPREEIVCGAGADDMIDLIIRIVHPRKIVIPTPTFPMFKFFALILRCEVVEVPLSPPPSFSLPLQQMLEEIRRGASLVFVASPNNPTGKSVARAQLETLLKEECIVVVDEAYIEFSDKGDVTDMMDKYPNLVILRTFSKWGAMAGLRCGYGLFHPLLADRIRQIKIPYNVSVAAESAARASLQHFEVLAQQIDRIKAERYRLLSIIKSSPQLHFLHPYDSDTNFILCKVDPGSAEGLRDQLRKRGVLVRYYATGMLKNFIRISCGRPEDTDRLIRELCTLPLFASEGGLPLPPQIPPKPLKTTPTALLFDMDGVLADVSQSYRKATLLAAEKYGAKCSSEDIVAMKRQGNANNDWILTQRLIKSKTEREVPYDDVVASFQEYYNVAKASEKCIIPLPVLESLRAQGTLLAVVTGRPRTEAEYFLSEHGLRGVFSVIVTMEDGPPKPDPGPVLLALDHLGLVSSGIEGWVGMIGDTPDDIRSAVAAHKHLQQQSSCAIDVMGMGVLTPEEAQKDRSHRIAATDCLVEAGAVRVARTYDDLLPYILPTTSSPPLVHSHDVSGAAGFTDRQSMRIGEVSRTTKETKISCRVCLGGSGKADVNTGVGFFDHMLQQLAKHGRFDISLNCAGDLHIDDHHTVEDCSIALGTCFDKALGSRGGINRFGTAYAPLDESLARAVVDLSGRGHSEVHIPFEREKVREGIVSTLAPHICCSPSKVGTLSTEMVSHIFYSLASAMKATIHIDLIRGVNTHHKVECSFKAFAQALRTACSITRAATDIPSTKGML